MDRTTQRGFLGILGLLAVGGLALVIWGGDQALSKPDRPTLDGVVVNVASTGLASVSRFTLRTDDGRTLDFGLGALRNGTTFPPGHLAAHVATSQPIRVWYAEISGGGLDALWLEDLPGP